MAFVVVSHQAPTGRNLLPEILAKTTGMPVREIEDETRVEPNHVYVAPRGHFVSMRNAGVLAIHADRASRAACTSRSISSSVPSPKTRETARPGSIPLGHGSDGTLGLAAIRVGSGLCLAQHPETAEFDGMPASAIAAQATDFVLTTKEMPARLLGRLPRPMSRRSRPPRLRRSVRRRWSGSPDPDPPTEAARTSRPTSTTPCSGASSGAWISIGIERLDDLRSSTRGAANDEIDALWRDWLIGAQASFFRDPEAFQALAQSGLAARLARTGERALGFASGRPGARPEEEAYSVAIVVLRRLESLAASSSTSRCSRRTSTRPQSRPPAPDAIRNGIAAEVGARRLDRFFVEEGRKMPTEPRRSFETGSWDLPSRTSLHYPPFTRVDLVSCRNLLIYVVPSAQQSLLSVLPLQLESGRGLLLLGASESVGGSAELYSTLDKRWKLFLVQRCPPPFGRPFRWTPRDAPLLPDDPGTAPPGLRGLEGSTWRRRLSRCLADRFGPPAVVVDLRGQIQQTHGRVGSYLELPPGRANLNVVEMARDGLRAPLTAALREAANPGFDWRPAIWEQRFGSWIRVGEPGMNDRDERSRTSD